MQPQHVGCPTENVVCIGGILVLGTTRSNLGDNMKNNANHEDIEENVGQWIM